MRYLIHESNVERLEKKLTTIGNKCKKYNCEFKYEVVGEQFVTTEERVNRYIEVEVEGTAKVNDWVFVATINFHEAGNVVRKCGNIEVEVPERFYTTEPICEHCSTKRKRKDAYVIMNTITREFKQVGRSCLKEFTQGLSAELIAQYIAMFDELIKGEAPSDGWRREYIEVKDYLLYVVECVKHFGYFNSMCDRPTKQRAYEYREALAGRLHSKLINAYKEEMEEVNFKHDTAENKEVVEEALAWIAVQDDENNYIHNVKVLASNQYVEGKDLGFIASLIATYYKAVDREVKKQKRAEVESKSEFIGTVGERITVEAETVECVTSWGTQFGVTFMYKLTDANNNIYIWKTSKCLENEKTTFVGTIKEHNEFRGVKQTELTRCKIK